MLKTRMKRRALCAGFCATVLLLPTEAVVSELQASEQAGRLVEVAQAVVEGQPKAEKSNQSLGIEFVSIPGGEFEMGSNDGDADEKPVHRVRVSAFKMSKTEVTQAQWRSVMGNSPSRYSGCDDCPVEQVSFGSVREFLQKASALTGLSLRLPTEAEWEYAAGGGAEHQKWAGTNNESDLGEYAWYNANAGSKTHPVCQKKPNRFGLCDMSGNVWEWCSDTYAAQYYAQSPNDNPTGPDKGPDRLARGGCWGYVPNQARSSNRDWFDTGIYTTIGFRLVTP